MTAIFLVTGGAGNLGGQIVPLLRDTGAQVRVLSRSTAPGVVTGDLTTGAGVDAALDGVHTVVNCAGSASGDGDKARTLVAAASRAGVRHIVNISVVGADRIPVVSRFDRAAFGYYESKLDAERVIAGSGVPWTTLRATQFHELVLTVARQLTRMPVVPVPAGMRCQPVNSGEVAERMAELALGEPAGLVPDLAGPRVYGLDELVRSYLRATGRRRPLVPVRFAGGAFRALRAGANLAPDGAVGHRSWEDFLAGHTQPAGVR